MRAGAEGGGVSAAGSGGDLLPWPAEWSGPRPAVRMVLNAVFITALTLAAGGVGVWALLSAETVTGVLFVAGAVYLGHVAGLAGWLLRLRRRGSASRVTPDVAERSQRGTSFPYSQWPCYWLTALVAMTWIVLVVIVPRRRIVRGRVVLSPAGVFHRSLGFEHFVPWYAVFAVAAEEAGSPLVVAKAFPSEATRVRRTTRVAKQQEYQLIPYLVVRGRWLAVDPALLYHTLRYYHAHPEARSELATEAGLRRIRGGNPLDRAAP